VPTPSTGVRATVHCVLTCFTERISFLLTDSCVLLIQYLCFDTFFASCVIAEQRIRTRWSLDDGLTMSRHLCLVRGLLCSSFSSLATFLSILQYLVNPRWYFPIRCCQLFSFFSIKSAVLCWLRIRKLLQVPSVTIK
jgi:hypothetical protein